MRIVTIQDGIIGIIAGQRKVHVIWHVQLIYVQEILLVVQIVPANISSPGIFAIPIFLIFFNKKITQQE
jgi:hypothetical protein